MGVIVVGGGWSGLAAAVELVRNGTRVTLIEAADRLGGRAARVHYQGRDYDSGQHLLIGAYHGILGLLATLGIDEQAVFERRPFELVSRSVHPAPDLHLRLPALPAPLHLLAGLIGAKGMGRSDKWNAVRFCLAVARPQDIEADYSVQELLSRHRQSPGLIARLWEPVCLAALNTPVHEASAAIFLRVLRAAFAHDRRDSDLLLPRRGLAAVLPEPAQRYIETRGGRVMLKRRVVALELELDDRAVTGVRLADGERLSAAHVILALPPAAVLRLIEPLAGMRRIAQDLSCLAHAAICTLYLQYPAKTRLEFPMTGLHGVLAQWVFDLGVSGHPGLMAAVISNPGAHLESGRERLQQRIIDELAAVFPEWARPAQAFLLCEKRATFLSRVGINALRPAVQTPVSGCWLAGDAVATGYPATLEGAVRSGLESARGLMAHLK